MTALVFLLLIIDFSFRFNRNYKQLSYYQKKTSDPDNQ